ncbi:MAG TPA: galactokinase [Blastocatellia bacterium]|jgi:galactokinase|nr:galactokinase [Blastocatellia bacterium]
MDQANRLKERFKALYDGRPDIFRAPGRVNLIGEHTDYNEGFVMPSAIGFYTWVAIARREDRKLQVHSLNFSESMEFDLDEANPRPLGHWSDYVRGVAVMLEKEGHRLAGASMVIEGEVPIGSGLSSSAAIEVAAGYAMVASCGLDVSKIELALLCQRAENEFVGARVGIMDQFISCYGEAGKALMLDCRSLDYRPLPLDPDARLVICNTMVKHALASGEYNTRRAECEAGVLHLKKRLPDVRTLRDVTFAELSEYGRDMPEVIFRRCRHVVTENARVLEAADALAVGDLRSFGRLMAASHRSLRDDYEVSCRELDIMVDLSSGREGVYGARMTGGGFGGCTINLVRSENVSDFKREVANGYEEATKIAPEIYICAAASGAHRVAG